MGKVLLTLYYHTDESHATDVSKKLEKEDFNGLTVPYLFSSPNRKAPDRRLMQKSLEYGCDHILTIHSDPNLEPYNYALVIFSLRTDFYRSAFNKLNQKFNAGIYSFQRPITRPVQIDIELNEYNSSELSIGIVKELLTLISNL